MEQFRPFIDEYKEEIIRSLQDCIKIKSVSGDRNGTSEVLDFYLGLAQKMGFRTTNVENLGGLIEFGEGQETIGMIVHLDVVPEGSGWSSEPFGAEIKDGRIYGRGAIDDKGPAISALYALKAVKDSGRKARCKIQIIMGVDEETVWDSTHKLLEKIRQPDFSFVPDSRFPLVIAEKGLLWLELKKDFSPASGGGVMIKRMQTTQDSFNLVPDYCEAELQGPEGLNTLTAHGKAAHAFACNEGENAISKLIQDLNALELIPPQKEFIQAYAEKIGLECYGESLGIAMEDELTGKLTVNPGQIMLDEKSVIMKIDLRFPASAKLDEMKTKVEKAFAVFGGGIEFIDTLPPLNFPENDEHIQKLLQVYRDYTGDTEAKPLGMGGTTFAKAFQNAVSFGPTFPGMPKVEHQPDEYMEIEHLLKCTEIYALAIQALCT